MKVTLDKEFTAWTSSNQIQFEAAITAISPVGLGVLKYRVSAEVLSGRRAEVRIVQEISMSDFSKYGATSFTVLRDAISNQIFSSLLSYNIVSVEVMPPDGLTPVPLTAFPTPPPTTHGTAQKDKTTDGGPNAVSHRNGRSWRGDGRPTRCTGRHIDFPDRDPDTATGPSRP